MTIDTTDQQAVTVAQDVTNLCRIMAKADGLDWDEVCPYENDCAENLGDVACDSGTCVAAHYEDHDVDVARGRYIGLAKAVLASVSSASAEGQALAGYRAAVSWISADSWDGCSDCIEILKAARAADSNNTQLSSKSAAARSTGSAACRRSTARSASRPGCRRT